MKEGIEKEMGEGIPRFEPIKSATYSGWNHGEAERSSEHFVSFRHGAQHFRAYLSSYIRQSIENRIIRVDRKGAGAGRTRLTPVINENRGPGI